MISFKAIVERVPRTVKEEETGLNYDMEKESA